VAPVAGAVLGVCDKILWSVAGYGEELDWLKFKIPERRYRPSPFFLIIDVVKDSRYIFFSLEASWSFL
jgi:hypothetical protein